MTWRAGDAREQRRARGIAGQAEDLAFLAGADEQRAVGVDQQIERPVVGRFPQRVPQAVGADAEDRPLGVARRLLDRCRSAGRDSRAGVDDGDGGDLGGDAGHRRARRLGRVVEIGAPIGLRRPARR